MAYDLKICWKTDLERKLIFSIISSQFPKGLSEDNLWISLPGEKPLLQRCKDNLKDTIDNLRDNLTLDNRNRNKHCMFLNGFTKDSKDLTELAKSISTIRDIKIEYLKKGRWNNFRKI